MKQFFLIVSLFASLHICAQKVVNDPNAKTRTLTSSFNAIQVSDGVELLLSQGGESLAISVSDDKYLDKFKTEVVNGVLKIYYDNNGINWSNNNKRKLKAYVSFKNIEKLTASGGASVMTAEPINVSKLEMKFTSGSEFTGDLGADQLGVHVNSGAEINLAGNSQRLRVDVSSGATFKGYKFETDYCEAKASSGGSIRISVRKELSAKANSGGGIHYRGDVSITDININSGGSVKKEKI